MTIIVGRQVDFGREAAARAPECLTFLPPLPPPPRHGREPRWNRTSARDEPICSRTPAYRRTSRGHPIGSGARTVSKYCSSCRTSAARPATSCCERRNNVKPPGTAGRRGPSPRAAAGMPGTPPAQPANPSRASVSTSPVLQTGSP